MKIKSKVIVYFTITSIIFILITLSLAYLHYREDYIKNLKENAMNTVSYASKIIDEKACKLIYSQANIDYRDLQKLPAKPDYLLSKDEIKKIELSSAYTKLVNQLNFIRDKQQETILYAYIIIPTKDKNIARFFADADLTEQILVEDLKSNFRNNLLAHFSKKYDISDQENTIKALQEQTSTISKEWVYDTEYKANSIMAFAPIVDEDNNYLGTIGIDLSDKKVKQVILENLSSFFLISLIILIVFIAIITILITLITNPLDKITKAVSELGNRNFKVKLNFERKDEIGILSTKFNSMAAKLEQYEKELIKLNNDLKDEKEELDITLKSIGDAVITTDLQGNIKLMNDVAERLTGYKFAEVRNHSIDKVFHIINIETKNKAVSPVQKVLNSSKIEKLNPHTALISKKNKEYLIEDSAAPIIHRNELKGVVLVFRDVTEKEKIENELANKQKLDSLGLLAGGIAHDFNNFLMGILGNINLAKINTKDPEIKENLQEAEKITISAKSLTRQLLTFSKGGDPLKETVNLKKLLHETIEFSLLGSNVKRRIEISNDLKNISADPNQIKQVLNNIIINAIQSMDNNGLLTIKALNCEKDKIIKEKLYKGKFVKIIISDTGSGMDESEKERIFDPFFSTKTKGNGLGLSTSYSIVKKHDGFIECSSQKGKGSTFSIFLPSSSKIKNQAQEKKSLELSKKRILILDDENIIRITLKKMLEAIGFEAVACECGEEVIETYIKAAESKFPFDLLILDLTVPNCLGGVRTLEKLKEYDKEVKAIISSGYSNNSAMSNYKKFGFIGKLVKPYQISELKKIFSKIF